MARTTLDLDPSVLRELRRLGERDGKNMGRVASELLAGVLREEEQSRPAFEWVTHNLGAPLVDLEDKEALKVYVDLGASP